MLFPTPGCTTGSFSLTAIQADLWRCWVCIWMSYLCLVLGSARYIIKPKLVVSHRPTQSVMDKLPTYIHSGLAVERPQRHTSHRLARVLVLCGVTVVWLWLASRYAFISKQSVKLPFHAEETLQKCSMLHARPGPPPDFAKRTQSDRFVQGTPATLLRNASVWTGDPLQYEIHGADILLDKGIIKFVGHASEQSLANYRDLYTVDVGGSWVTPG